MMTKKYIRRGSADTQSPTDALVSNLHSRLERLTKLVGKLSLKVTALDDRLRRLEEAQEK